MIVYDMIFNKEHWNVSRMLWMIVLHSSMQEQDYRARGTLHKLVRIGIISHGTLNRLLQPCVLL